MMRFGPLRSIDPPHKKEAAQYKILYHAASFQRTLFYHLRRAVAIRRCGHLVTAGDRQAVTGDERCVIAGEEEHSVGDIFRLTESLERYVLEEALDEFLGHIVEQGISSDHAGHDASCSGCPGGRIGWRYFP